MTHQWGRTSIHKQSAAQRSNDWTMTPKLFKEINELLARLIYNPDTPEPLRKAAKDTRQPLHRLYGTNNKPARLHKMRTAPNH